MIDHPMIADLSDTEVSPLEAEWKQLILPKVLGTLDLSMIGMIDEKRSRTQIRDIANRLINEEAAPLSLLQRRHVVRQI